MKTRTCTRCNGTGFRNTPVLHLGVPGLCYGCNGTKTQQWVEAATITAERQRSIDSHIVEIKGIIADCEAGLRLAKPGRGRTFREVLVQRTEQLQTMQRTATPAKKGEWRALGEN